MTTLEIARQIAEAILDAQIRPGVEEDVIINETESRETGEFWVFFYNTRAFLEAGSVVHALAGNGPIMVEKASGVAHIGRSDVSWEEQV